LTGTSAGGATVAIASLSGRVITRIKVDKKGCFPLSGLPPGVYIMQAVRPSGRLCATKTTVIDSPR